MLRPFRMVQPQSVAEASAELARLGEAAKVYAGGSELLLLLRQGLVQYDHLVNVKGIKEMGALSWDGKKLHIGASVTHRQLERSPEVAKRFPMLQQAEAVVANVRVRNIGTLGGNLSFGDPHSDPATALLVYDTQVKMGKKRATRTLGLDEFFVGLYETALAQDEVLVELEVDPLPPGTGGAYLRVSRFERPSLGVAVAAGRREGRLTGVRMAVGCVGPVPLRLKELEAKVEGATLAEGQRIVREARAHLAQVLDPVDDLHGSVDYKTYMAGVLLGRGLAQATGANGGS